MPIYAFRCSTGHVTDVLCSFETRPVVTACGACGAEAALAVTAGRMGGTTEQTRGAEFGGYELRVKGAGLEASDYACEACGERSFEVETELPATMPCACGGTKVRSLGVPDVDWITKMGPGGYFCNAMGVQVTSKGQRALEMKRRGLVDGSDVDVERLNAQYRAQCEAADAWAREEAARMDRDAELQRKREAGLVPDWSWMHRR